MREYFVRTDAGARGEQHGGAVILVPIEGLAVGRSVQARDEHQDDLEQDQDDHDQLEELAAVHRRADYELGLELTDIELALPLFRYRATDANGIVEHELCPVYTARTHAEPVLNPLEVVDAKWVDPADLAVSLATTPWAFSPWLVLQAEQLRLFGAADEQRRAS